MIGPVKAAMHPKAQIPVIAREAIKRVVILQRISDIDQAIVLLDREDRLECPGQLAEQLGQQIQPHVTIPVSVVITDRMFENWLVADIEALRRMRARFSISTATVRSIAPNRADRVDAYAVLQSCVRNQAYDKVQDAGRILERSDIHQMAANSRSFRRFLRCVGDPAYSAQSRNPA